MIVHGVMLQCHNLTNCASIIPNLFQKNTSASWNTYQCSTPFFTTSDHLPVLHHNQNGRFKSAHEMALNYDLILYDDVFPSETGKKSEFVLNCTEHSRVKSPDGMQDVKQKTESYLLQTCSDFSPSVEHGPKEHLIE